MFFLCLKTHTSVMNSTLLVQATVSILLCLCSHEKVKEAYDTAMILTCCNCSVRLAAWLVTSVSCWLRLSTCSDLSLSCCCSLSLSLRSSSRASSSTPWLVHDASCCCRPEIRFSSSLLSVCHETVTCLKWTVVKTVK